MAAEWYYAKGREKVGPLTEAQAKDLIRSGELARSNMVWKQGMAKWTQAGQVKELFDDPILPANSGPPPLPVEEVAKVVAVLVASSAAELFYIKNGKQGGPVSADQLRALISPSDLVWKPGLSAWVAASTVPTLFSGGPSPASSTARGFPASGPTAAAVCAASTTFPWAAEERAARNFLKLIPFGVGILCGLVAIVIVILATRPHVDPKGAEVCFLWFLGVTLVALGYGTLELFSVVAKGYLRGRWVSAEDGVTWIEFLSGGNYKAEDGTVGRFVLLKNHKFIDFLVANRLVDSWKILAWGMKTLEIQDTKGKARSFTKGKTLEEAASSPSSEQAHTPSPLAIPRRVTGQATEPGISDPSVAKQVAQKKAAAQWHAVPVEKRSISDVDEAPVFSGDGPCPKCKTIIFVDWQTTNVTMKCPICAYCFDGKKAIAFLSAYKAEDNNMTKIGEVTEFIETADRFDRTQALLARVEAAGGLPTSDPGTPQNVSAHTSPPVKKREPGIWHRLKSALSPDTNKCPQCGENLAGEDKGTELIDRQKGIQTKMQMDVTDHGRGEHTSRTFRDAQVVVYHDTYWQYLKCKFCDHEWREKRKTTYQP